MLGDLDDDAGGQKHSTRRRRGRDAYRDERRGGVLGPAQQPPALKPAPGPVQRTRRKPVRRGVGAQRGPCACQARRWSSQNCWRALLARGACESGYVAAMACPSNGRWDIDRGTAARPGEGRTSQRAYAPTTCPSLVRRCVEDRPAWRSRPVPNPSNTVHSIALASTFRRRRTAPLSWARRSISAFGSNVVNVCRIPIHLCRATAIPPDLLKPLNSNLIRGRGPLQVLVSSSIPTLFRTRMRAAAHVRRGLGRGHQIGSFRHGTRPP